MKKNVREDATENAIELGLDDLKAISGGMSPEARAHLTQLRKETSALELAASDNGKYKIAGDYRLIRLVIEDVLIASEKNP